jgi:hypothetical protein
MSDEPEPLFRQEALEYVNQQRGPGQLLRLSPTWLDRAYLVFLVLVVLGALLVLGWSRSG